MTKKHRTTILIIDDDAAVRQSFVDYLEDLDYRILTAENGRIGLEVFEGENTDLVLVDLRMPEVDGLEVLAHIRKTSPDTPLIVVSGTGVIADAVEALRRGAWDYMLKPVEDLTVLSYAIKNALEKARLKQENRRYQEHLEQMVNDRTKEKIALEKQLIQAQKMEALGTLAGGIAHDFNNILSALMGFTELCLLELDDPEHPVHRKLKSMLHAENRAKELVSQILTFSRMQEHVLTPVSISPIVKEALKLLKASLPANIELKQGINSHQQVMADPTRIHQILMNLCTNAYHAMEENGGLLTVSLTSDHCDEQPSFSHGDLAPGSYLRLTVEDTGAGIPPAILDNIFDPYFSTKGKDKGTGLGLAVVHGIVKSHGGAIHVKSRVGKGTAVQVFLPVTDDNQGAEEELQAVLPRGTERILLVDDEKDLVDIGCLMLVKLGYDVLGVVGSIAALETFKQSPHGFDLVITDLDMPVMNGDRLARELVRIRPGLPIIMCTGFSERFDGKGAQNLGIRNLIIKPLSMKILAKSVRDVLDGS
ncbi:MAG: response regulator [Deltaproteobacteria bacterium]|nr:response regulator [Deltaproteobacteria bacterium]